MMYESVDEGIPLTSAHDVYAIYAGRIEDLPYEEFHVCILDGKHRLESDVLITRGLVNSSLAHPREVFRQAIAENACAVILVHNHPSGDPTPSREDLEITAQLVTAGKVLGITVVDHVIIGRGRFTSFSEHGILV
jgi:DNA repair protein RadC